MRKVTFNPCICNRFTHACFSVLILSDVLLGNYLKYTHMTSDIFQVHTLQCEAPKEGCGDVSGAINEMSSWDFVSSIQQSCISPVQGHSHPWELCGALGEGEQQCPGCPLSWGGGSVHPRWPQCTSFGGGCGRDGLLVISWKPMKDVMRHCQGIR